MGIQARNNGFGNFLFKENWFGQSQRTQANGLISTSTGFLVAETHRCGRDGKSSNPKMTYKGIPGYRLPSAYRRYVYEARPISGNFTWKYTSVNPPSPTTVVRIDAFQQGNPLGALNNNAYPTGIAGPYINRNAVEYQNLVGRTTTIALDKMGDRKVDFGVSMAESVKSFAMVGNTAIDILAALIAVKHGNYHRAAKILGLDVKNLDAKRLNSRFLEYTYGWKPLVDEILGGLDLIKTKLAEPASRIITTSHTGSTSVKTDASGKSGKKITANIGVRTCITARVTDKWLRTTQQAGIIDPLTMGWEVIPYSFLVDWMVPVGTYLRAMRASDGLEFISGWRSYRMECQGEYTETPGSGWSENSPIGVYTRGYAIEREPIGDFPMPRIFTKSPFSTTHAVNFTSLMYNLTPTGGRARVRL